MQNYMMTEKLQLSNYIAAVLMVIRRNYQVSKPVFQQIISNGIVLDELVNNYDYYHMYDYNTVIEELSEKEILLTGLLDK